MATKQEVQALRSKMGDSQAMKRLYESDPQFRTVVDKVNESMPSVTAVERAKLPTYLLNRVYSGSFYGNGPRPTDASQQTMSRINTQQRELASQGKMDSYGGLLDSNPIERASLGGFAGNVLKSGARLIQDVGNAVMHPIKTAEGIGKAAIGGGINAIETLAGNEELFNNPLGSEDVANSIGDFYVQRYGGLENLKKTAYEDPIGLLSDAAALISAGGGAASAVSKVAQIGAKAVPLSGIASKAAKVGNIASKAASTIDPLAATAKVAGLPFKALGKAVKVVNDANVRSAFNLTPSQMQRINKMGESASSFMGRNGIVGNNVDDVVKSLAKSYESSYDDVNKALAGINKTYNVSSIDDLQSILRNLTDDFNEPGLASLREEALALAAKDSLTLTEFNAAKRLIDKADFIYGKSGDIKAGMKAIGASNVRNSLKTFIEQRAAENGVKNIGELNQNTRMAKGIMDEITNAAGKGERFLSLRDLIYGGVGGLALGPVGGFGTIIAERLAATPVIATRLNLMLQSLSQSEFNAVMKALKEGTMDTNTQRILQSIIRALDE